MTSGWGTFPPCWLSPPSSWGESFITNWLFDQITNNPHFSNGLFSSLAGGALRSGTLAFSTFVGWETFTYYQWQVFVYLGFSYTKTQAPMHKYNQENNQITKDSNVFSQGCSQLTSSGLSNLIQLRQVYFSWTISNNRNMYFLYFSRIIIINAIQLPAWRAWVDQLPRVF